MEDFVFYIRSLIEPHCENFDKFFRKKRPFQMYLRLA